MCNTLAINEERIVKCRSQPVVVIVDVGKD